MNLPIAPEPESNVTVALVERVADRLATGVPLSQALAGEVLNCAEYEEHLRRQPGLAAHEAVAKRKFLQNAIKILLAGKDSAASVRWLLGRLYPDVFGQQRQNVTVNDSSVTGISRIDDAVIDLRALVDLMANPPLPKRQSGSSALPPDRKAFCDFAWGGNGDENVLAVRDGNVVTLEETFRADNLHAICGRFVAAFNRLGLKAHQIDGDEGGGGKLICDQLQAMGWRINRVNNGAAPRFCGDYANVAAEMWFEAAKQIARREIILPNDDDLCAQMLDRKRVSNARGKLAVESKSDMKRRGVDSPDRADALFGAMMPVRRVQSVNISNGNCNRGLWNGFKGWWRFFWG